MPLVSATYLLIYLKFIFVFNFFPILILYEWIPRCRVTLGTGRCSNVVSTFAFNEILHSYSKESSSKGFTVKVETRFFLNKSKQK